MFNNDNIKKKKSLYGWEIDKRKRERAIDKFVFHSTKVFHYQRTRVDCLDFFFFFFFFFSSDRSCFLTQVQPNQLDKFKFFFSNINGSNTALYIRIQ
jgi:hypothetical protein